MPLPAAFPTGLQSPDAFPAGLSALGHKPLVVCHNDADGLSAGAILLHALRRGGREPDVRIIGKGENAYSREFAQEIAGSEAEGMIIADLGVAPALPRPDLPTILIDHHVPTGLPEGALIVSGIHDSPIPTSSLLAYRCARAAGLADGLLWLAAIGLIGDLAENDGFPEMDEARKLGITALRKAASLVNAPRRTASGDASPALDLLLKADGPKAVLSGEHEETAQLLAAKDEVKRELNEARKIGPKVVGEVALVLFSSPTQIHPLVAQAWRGRIKDRIVIAANAGYRDGYVHFAARTAADRDLLAFLAEHQPPGATEQYGNGHRLASGGALTIPDWNQFIASLGFGREAQISPEKAA
ncbi:DHH family phosphoesterase [Aureimonas sp. N4]|uniref:DHH family phosphoesterase n=1 Tax=Aureimonas sp. N4 TaxID=1638165 RepID=UPI000784B744|nr:DHH family phosphoesterase [Aureimonas sp. N4]